MAENVIEAQNLVKEFIVYKKSRGLRGAVKNLFKPEKSVLRAVDGVSFTVQEGEIVGYIGPNGAGKSTTIKMMCGILNPTEGTILVNGLSPSKDRQKIVRTLGVVFGQRSQLYWDLRLGESFELLRRIYGVPKDRFDRNFKQLDGILHLGEIIDTPVRQLSLGQRMRGDLAAAMLHSPAILFLDEPTIGLDVDAKYAVRKFIKEINREYRTTVILTTHDLDDVQALCERIIVINHGKIVSDCTLDRLIEAIDPTRQLTVDFYTDQIALSGLPAQIEKIEGQRAFIRFKKNEVSTAELIRRIAEQYPIRDLSLEDANIDDIIRQIYHSADGAVPVADHFS